MKRIALLATLAVFSTALPAWQAMTAEQMRAYMMARQIRYSTCEKGDIPKCRRICEAETSLSESSDDLKRCADQRDHSDSCDGKFRDVRDAHDELEEAVSDAGSDCD